MHVWCMCLEKCTSSLKSSSMQLPMITIWWLSQSMVYARSSSSVSAPTDPCTSTVCRYWKRGERAGLESSGYARMSGTVWSAAILNRRPVTCREKVESASDSYKHQVMHYRFIENKPQLLYNKLITKGHNCITIQCFFIETFYKLVSVYLAMCASVWA